MAAMAAQATVVANSAMESELVSVALFSDLNNLINTNN